MPGRNGTGPEGLGPMTGWGAGYCARPADFGYAAFAGRAAGFGRGQGFGRMRCAAGRPGWARIGRFAYGPAADEKEMLKRQAEFLENQLEMITKHLANLRDESE